MEVKSSINIGTFCSHFQGGHWRKTPNMNNNNISAGQTTGRDFFKMVPSKKSKNTTSSTSAILSTGNGKSTNTKASNINSVGNKQDFLVAKRSSNNDNNLLSNTEDNNIVNSNIEGNKANAKVEIEHVFCRCIIHKGLTNIILPPGFSFIDNYPSSIHSPVVREKYGNNKTHLIPARID